MVETPSYEVVRRMEDVEIRRYEKMILASVSGDEMRAPFRVLFDYISGNNSSRSKISMTAPVITPEQIDMTAPVIRGGDSMSFIVPSKYTLESVPIPNDRRVRIHEVPERQIAVIRFGGWARERSIENQKSKLISVLRRNGIGFIGELFLMRYNSPWIPGFMRRNEVGVEIARASHVQ